MVGTDRPNSRDEGGGTRAMLIRKVRKSRDTFRNRAISEVTMIARSYHSPSVTLC